MHGHRRWFLAALIAALMLVPSAAPTPARAAGRSISWSGHDWWVLDSPTTKIAAGPNYWSSSSRNVWVDTHGRLHLKITKRDGKWFSAELVGLRPLGYGNYRWTLGSSVANLDPNVVVGLFQYGDDADQAHREIDIEFGRWGATQGNLDAQYVRQPHDEPMNRFRFEIPDVRRSAHSYTWSPASLAFHSEWDPTKGPGQAWVYPGVPPTSLDETPRISLWLFKGRAPMNGREVEVIIEGFSFTAD